jgi:uncharacterized protein
MKLFRTDLNRGIDHQLYEIPAHSLDLGDLELVDDTLYCSLTVDKGNNQYRLIGSLKATVVETCDRCLDQFQEVHEPEFDILLTAKQELVNESNLDVIWFPDTEDLIDLGPSFMEILLLEEPLKKLCHKECRGLCPHCGTNLNHRPCSCKVEQGDQRWEALRSL